MKKLIALLLFFAGTSFAQNIQFHYDFGKNGDETSRKYFTTTLEMFKPDEYGATFFFVDFDYNLPGNKSASLAYWEIARYINVYKKLALTIQYNDGFVAVPGEAVNNAFTLNQTWLAGVSYPINLGFVTLNTDFLFRKTYGSDSPDGQLTTVWFIPFMDGKLNFTGFMDIWSQDEALRAPNFTSEDKEIVFLAEPQLWYNVNNHLSIGTEIEISNNFLPLQDKILVNPTAALKWNF